MSQRPDPRAAILALAEDGALEPLDGIAGAFLRRLSIDEVDRIARIEEDNGVHLFTMCIVDGDGEPLFTAADIAALKRMKAASWKRIMTQVTKVNSMGGDALEEAAKN